MLNLQTEWCYVLEFGSRAGLSKASYTQRDCCLIPLPGMALSHPKHLNPKEYQEQPSPGAEKVK